MNFVPNLLQFWKSFTTFVENFNRQKHTNFLQDKRYRQKQKIA